MKLEEVSYVGGKAMPDGTSVQFYLVGIRQQADPTSITSRICLRSIAMAKCESTVGASPLWTKGDLYEL